MRKHKYDVTLHGDNSPEKFKSACIKIEAAFPDWNKNELLLDVDGSLIQVFKKGQAEIIVYDDYEVGAVYVLSDIDIERVVKLELCYYLSYDK